MTWSRMRATVMGLGTRAGGVGVARYLAEQGGIVTVTDLRSEEALAGSVAELADLPVRFVLGRHDERDFLPGGADLVVRNPGVPRGAPLLAAARAAGVPVEGICLYPVLNHLGWDDDRHCQNGLLDFPHDATGCRGVVAPLADELSRQQALFAEAAPAPPRRRTTAASAPA